MPALPAGLWRVMLGTALVVSSFSLLNPVLAVRLQNAGASSTVIGFIAMLPFVSVALLVPVASRVFARIGVGQAYRLGLVLELLSCLGYLLTDDVTTWACLGLMAGVGAAAAWNATEGLIAHNVPASHRGRITGFYQALLGAGMALGPMLPGLFGLTPVQANGWAAAALALGLALNLAPSVGLLSASHEGHAHMSLMQAWRFRPALAWAALVGGVFEVGLSSVTTAYGAQLGLSLGMATSIAGTLGLGSFVFQYPMGWLADRLASQRLFAACAVLLAFSGVLFSVSAQWPAAIWLCAMVWGGVGGALYTLSMIRVAHDFADSSALAGTSAMIAGYTVGGALGPLASGWALDHFGAGGQGTWLALLSLSLWLVQQDRAQRPAL